MPEGGEMTFWDHLEALRGTLVRMIVAVLLCSVCIFCMKNLVFDHFVFAPLNADFYLYRLLNLNMDITLVNLDITAQFMTHLKISCMLGLIVSFPYLVYELWRFVAPALYSNEKSAIRKVFGFAGVLFYAGVAVGYFIVLPVTLNFFQSYSISDSLQNSFSLQSYISMLISMLLMFGIVFEFPTLLLILSKLNIINRSTLRKYRRHAIVSILVIAAIITPADPLSMLIAAAPLYLLYEFSVIVCTKEINSK